MVAGAITGERPASLKASHMEGGIAMWHWRIGGDTNTTPNCYCVEGYCPSTGDCRPIPCCPLCGSEVHYGLSWQSDLSCIGNGGGEWEYGSIVRVVICWRTKFFCSVAVACGRSTIVAESRPADIAMLASTTASAVAASCVGSKLV